MVEREVNRVIKNQIRKLILEAGVAAPRSQRHDAKFLEDPVNRIDRSATDSTPTTSETSHKRSYRPNEGIN